MYSKIFFQNTLGELAFSSGTTQFPITFSKFYLLDPFTSFVLDIFQDSGYLLLLLLLAFGLVFGNMLLVPREYDIEKNSAYECGFHPFEDTRSKFDVRFYLVAILFIIFDLEVAFLFPWVVVFNRNIGFSENYIVLLFLSILGVGFYYEWQKGALDWE
jgi:NADH-quinone oxidoreductase subunit A